MLAATSPRGKRVRTFSTDGKRIVSGSHDNSLKVWDVRPLDNPE